VRWAGHVARMGEDMGGGGCKGSGGGNRGERDPGGDQGVGGGEI